MNVMCLSGKLYPRGILPYWRLQMCRRGSPDVHIFELENEEMPLYKAYIPEMITWQYLQYQKEKMENITGLF